MASKKGWTVFARVLEALIVLLAVGIIAVISSAKVQSYLSGKLLGKLEEKSGIKVSTSSIKISPKAIVLHDVYVADDGPYTDTLLYAKKIRLSFGLRELIKEYKADFNSGLTIQRLNADGLYLTFVADDDPVYKTNAHRILNVDDPSEYPQAKGDIFAIKNVLLRDFRIRYINYCADAPKYKGVGINWADIDLRAEIIKGRNLNYLDSRVSGDVLESVLYEKCGYGAVLTGSFATGCIEDEKLGLTEVIGAHLIDKWSDLKLDYLSMEYHTFSDWSNFINGILMRGWLHDTTLALQSLAYFTGAFNGSPMVLQSPKTEIRGTVNDLDIKTLNITERYSDIHIEANGRIRNIANPEGEKLIKADVPCFDFTSEGVNKIVKVFEPEFITDLSKYAEGLPIHFKGSMDGWIDNMNVNGVAETPCGVIVANGRTYKPDNRKTNTLRFNFDGSANLINADIGKFSGLSLLGEGNALATASGYFDEKLISASIDTVYISDLKLHEEKQGIDYTLRNVSAHGDYAGREFDGRVHSKDENAQLEFNGHFQLDSTLEMNGILDLIWIDLEKLGIDKRGGGSAVSGRLAAESVTINEDTAKGNILGSNICYHTDTTTANFGKFKLRVFDGVGSKNKGHGIELADASFAHIKFSADKPLDQAKDLLMSSILGRYFISERYPQQEWKGSSYTLDFSIKDPKPLYVVAKKGINIENGSKLYLELGTNGYFKATAKSDALKFEDICAKGVNLYFTSKDSTKALSGRAPNSIDSLSFKKFILTEVIISNFNASNDSLTAEVRGQHDYIQDIVLKAGARFFPVADTGIGIRGRIRPSSGFTFGGSKWSIGSDTFEYAGKDDITLATFKMGNGKQLITANGSLRDSIKINVSKFDLGIVNAFIGSKMSIGGIVNGNGSIGQTAGGQATISGVSLNGVDLGDIRTSFEKDDDLVIINNLEHLSPAGKEDMKIIGDNTFYNLTSAILQVKSLNIDNLELSTFQDLVKDYASDLRGSLSGHLNVYGSVKDFYSLQFDGSKVNFNDASFTLLPTGIPYTIGGSIEGKDGDIVPDLVISDDKSGNASVSGDLDSLKVDLKKLHILNNKGKIKFVKGDVATSGSINIIGIMEPKTSVIADLVANTKGNIEVAVANLDTGKESSLLSFSSFLAKPEITEDSEEEDEDEVQKSEFNIKSEAKGADKKKQQFDINADLAVTDALELKVKLDDNNINTIVIKGESDDVKVGFNTENKALNIHGNYIVSDGKYTLDAVNLVKKDFEIEKGSTLQFLGQPLDTKLDIKAIHRTRANISNLIQDTTSIAKNKEVLCLADITGTVNALDLKFDVEVEDKLDPDIQTMVDSELNTEDKRLKQFFAVLTTGAFIPSASISNAAGSELVLRNLASIATGQLSNLMSAIGIPVNFGMDYKQNQAGKSMVDLNISTQLFNNRVVASGSIGNRNYSSTSSDEIVGDLDIEYKVDRSGNFRTKIFSHSADDYTNYLDNTQRNGIGASFQKEFGNIFRKKSSANEKNTLEID